MPTQGVDVDTQYSHAPVMAEPVRVIPPRALPHGEDATEDARADIDSLDLQSRNPTATTEASATQDIEAEGATSSTSCTSSPTSSSDAAFAHDCSTWLPTGYFVFPDPLSPDRGVDTIPGTIEKHAAASSGNKQSIAENKAAAGLENKKPSPVNVSLKNAAEPDPAPSVNDKTNQFLPLLKDEPNYPRNPALDLRLE